MNPNDIESKRKRTETIVKCVGLLGLCIVLGPLFTTIIHGIGAIAALIALGGALFTVNKFLPWASMKISNLAIKAIKAEASANPMETLQDELRQEMVKLDTRKTNIEKLNATIRKFSDKVDMILNKYGKNDTGYIKLKSDLEELRRIYKDRVNKWNAAQEKLAEFAESIARGNMIWDAAQAAAAARETSGLTQDEFFAKLRTETAFDAIQTSYNEALASLDSAMLETPTAVRNAEEAPEALADGEQ
jgi:chromosome segregation ATPase